jgi:hypothetical protein
MTTPLCRRLPAKKKASIHRCPLFLGSLLAAMMLLTGAASAQQTFDFKTHPYFKNLQGDWTSEGQGGGTGGKVERYKVQWKGEALDANTFIIEGAVEAEGKTTHYKKTITRSASGACEAVIQPDTSKPATQRYAVQLSPDGTRMEMTLLLGDKAKQVIVDAFKGGGHDEVEYKLKITDATGAVTYSSMSASKRVKKSAASQ